MKKFSKILVLLLTFSLLLGTLAIFASAAEGDDAAVASVTIGETTTPCASFDEAMTAALASTELATVTLLADASTSQGWSLTSNVIVDLNGYTLTDPASVTALLFHAQTADTTVVFKNGIIEYAGNNCFQVTGNNATLGLYNLYVKHTVADNSQYVVNYNNVSNNVTNLVVDNCLFEASRIMNFSGNHINIDATNSVFKSTNNNNIIRLYGTALIHGEINFTNCHMYTTGSGRLIEPAGNPLSLSQFHANTKIGEEGTADDLDVEYALVSDGTYKVTKADLAVFNFYNCTLYSEGDCTIGPACFEMNFYGGYYRSQDAMRMAQNPGKSTTERQGLGRVYFHTYTDAAGVVHYPAFNVDFSNTNTFKHQDFWDTEITFTISGTTYGTFCSPVGVAKENAAKLVANANADAATYKYVFVPAGDTSTPSVADPIALSNAVAMVNGKLYTDFGLAAADAGESMVTLLANVAGGTEVTAPVTVNTNGFDLAPTMDTLALMTQTVSGNLVAIVEVSDDALVYEHFYWESEEASLAVTEEQWTAFYENGVYPAGLKAYKELPAESSADFTSVGFAGEDLTYVDGDQNLMVHTGWEKIGGSAEEAYFDYKPTFQNVGKATFIIIDDATGAIIGSGITDEDDMTDDSVNYSVAFTNAMNTASAGTTIKLVADIAICSDNNDLADAAFTLDLNGHTLTLSGGDCISKTLATSSTCGGGHKVGHNSTFRVTGTLKLTVKSSVPGGMIHNLGINGNQLFWLNGVTGGYLNIEGENLTVYGNSFVAATVAAAATAPFEVTINGGKYYTQPNSQPAQAFLQMSGGKSVKMTVKDAFIDCSGHNVISVGLKTDVATAGHKAEATFENCVIIVGKQFFKAHNNEYLTTTTVNLKNTAVLGKAINLVEGTKDADKTPVTLNVGEGCFFTHEPAAAINTVDCEFKPLSGGYAAAVTSTYGFGQTGTPYDPVNTHTAARLEEYTKTTNYTYAYGTTYATVELAFGEETITKYVYVPVGGTTVTLTESVTENYIKSTYSASVEVAEAGKTYTGTLALTLKEVVVSGVKYNLTLASEIAVNVAIPADVLNYLTVVVGENTFTKENATLITIGEESYYVVSYTGITAVDTVDNVVFALSAEGATAQNVEVSVAAYAETLMNKGATDVEKELGRALIVYTLEAYRALDAESTDAIEALTEIGAEAKADATFAAQDTSMLARVFKGAYLRLEGTPGIVFEVSDTMSLVTVSFTYVDENLETVTETVTLNSTNPTYELEMKVYNLDQNITVSIDGQPLELSYNLDTYLASLATENNAFAQAIYHYVAAAKAYVAPVVAE